MPQAATTPGSDRWRARRSRLSSRSADRPYHAAAAVADAGGNVFGQVVAAIPADDAFAAALREATQDEVLLLSDTRRAGVHAAGRRRRRGARATSGGAPAGAPIVRPASTSASQQFAAREVVLADQPALSAVILKSRDEAIEPFRRIQNGIVLIGLLCAVVAAAGSFWIARTEIRN